MEFVKEGFNVLYVWSSGSVDIENQVNNLKAIKNVQVNVENNERLLLASYYKSTFDVVIYNKGNEVITDEVLKTLLNVLKPKCKLVISGTNDSDDLKSKLLLSGFLNIQQQQQNIFISEKPNYEVGSSAKLSFGKKPEATKAIWKLDVDDDEIMDDDDLLDESDKAKPDPSTLRVCGTTGKRKACKDCSCGLAEELDAESKGKQTISKPIEKSSCGSCYLGDAFRCASCPYLGMPAFKPGEKIQLSDRQLKADA